jgi:hypothetical protein
VPLGSEFSVTVALNGYTPETRTVRPVSAEASAGSPGATALLDPNPLFVELRPTAPPKPPPPPKKKRRRPIQAAAPAAEAPPPAAPPGFGPAPGGFGPPPGRSGSRLGKRKFPTLPSPKSGREGALTSASRHRPILA